MRPDEGTALELLALSEPLPVDLLLEMVGEETLERLEERGLLVVDGSARSDARLSHPLLADVLLDALGPIRRRRLLRDLVAAVSARPLPVDVGDRVVRWRIDAGLDVSAGELLTTARRYLLVDVPLAESLTAPRPGRRRRERPRRGHRRWPRSSRCPAARTRLRPSWPACRPARPETTAAGRSTSPSCSPSGSTDRADAAERLERLLHEVDDRDWGFVAGQIPLMWLLAGEIHRARRAAEDSSPTSGRPRPTGSPPSWCWSRR